MADDTMTADERSKKALQDEKIQKDLLERETQRQKEQVDHKHTDDWALL